MIIFCNLKDISEINGDAKYAIVKNYKTPIYGVEKLPTLAPSRGLSSLYFHLESSGRWQLQTYRDDYINLFKAEMDAKRPRNAIISLARMSKRYNIVLGTYGTAGSHCCRKVLTRMFEEQGADVAFFDRYYMKYAV